MYNPYFVRYVGPPSTSIIYIDRYIVKVYDRDSNCFLSCQAHKLEQQVEQIVAEIEDFGSVVPSNIVEFCNLYWSKIQKQVARFEGINPCDVDDSTQK